MSETYSGKQISRAGKQLVSDNAEEREEGQKVLSYWRLSHEKPLENALEILRTITIEKDKNATFAKRLKRKFSISGKLERFPEMSLKTMQDIGGCRAIVSTPKQVKQIARILKKRPEFKNNLGKVRFKDYLDHPKDDGYRGYHLIGKFSDSAGKSRNIELQIRTKLQHNWATTLEVVELFTGQALKSNKAEEKWQTFFKNVSAQFSVMEKAPLFSTLSKQKKLEAYGEQLLANDEGKHERIKTCIDVKDQARKLDIVSVLEAYAHSLKVTDDWLKEKSSVNGYVLLEINKDKSGAGTIKGSFYLEEDIELAEKEYTKIESLAADTEGTVVALVSTTAVGGIREAYPNYFADSADFLEHIKLIIQAPVSMPKESILTKILRSFRRG